MNIKNSSKYQRLIRSSLVATLNNHGIKYPSPINLNYLWGFGSLAMVCLGIQIVTGILLAMHYTPHILLAFNSVEHIMRDVNSGWLIRYIHSNGASMFFIVVYSHIFRGLYYGSYAYPREHLWFSGISILIIMMGTAFLGYVLPWGQMSFWGATVITNLVSAIPLIGESIVQWLWGGFSVDNATLNRFFSLHYALPFILVGLVLIHISLLHLDGSNNPTGIDSPAVDKIDFTPYFYVKDLFGFFLFILFFGIFVFFFPNMLGHSDNYINANPMVTPPHIVPEWYFLPFYAILRSIPNKLGGVLAMFASLLILASLPYVTRFKSKSTFYKPIFKLITWFFIVDCVILGWIGQKEVVYPYIQIGQISTIIYFGYFLVLLPLLTNLEKKIIFKK